MHLGRAVETPYHPHSHSTKAARRQKGTFPLEAGNVQEAATEHRDEAQDLSPPDAFQMPIISCTYTVFLQFSMLHTIIQESSFAFRLFFPPL